MEVPVLNLQGQKVGTLTVDEASLGGEVIPALIKQAYVRYHSNTRQGSARSKSRGMVEGSTRKLYKQKHTGNARVGPTRSPTRKGGGHAFAKVRGRESFRLDMPIKMRRKANRNALLAKLIDGEVRVIDSLTFTKPQTKAFKSLLEACKINRSCLVALPEDNTNARLSARNLDDVTVCNARQLTCFEMLNHRFMVIAKEDLVAWLQGPSSQTTKIAARTGAEEAN